MGLGLKCPEDIREPIDSLTTLSSKPDAEELETDRGLPSEINKSVDNDHRPLQKAATTRDLEKGDSILTGPIYVEFLEGDERNPVNFSWRKKWAITLMASSFTLIASIAAGSYNLGFPSMIQDLNCTEFQATIGLGVYPLGFGVIALITVAFSEEFGRQKLYFVSMTGFLMMHLVIALAKSVRVVILARFFQGAFGSTGATMVAGTIADIWMPHQRGIPMSIFSLVTIGGIGLGPIIGGWIEMNPRLQWRWIQWIELMIGGVYLVVFPFVMRETRSAILLLRLARKLRKETGDHRYRARIEDERTSLRTLIFISCTRPIYLLLTEPIVMSFSLWIGFAWGVVFCLIETIGGVFQTLHNFNDGEVGTVFVGIVIGTILGSLCNRYQERLYQKG